MARGKDCSWKLTFCCRNFLSLPFLQIVLPYVILSNQIRWWLKLFYLFVFHCRSPVLAGSLPWDRGSGSSLHSGEGAGEFKLVICIKRPFLCTTSPLNSTLQQGYNADLMSSQDTDTGNAIFKLRYLHILCMYINLNSLLLYVHLIYSSRI